MQRIFLIILALFFAVPLLGQKQYRKFREVMNGLTCTDSNAVTNAKTNIPILEKYISEHPDHYDAYYDLAMEYYTLAVADSSNRDIYIIKCIETNEKYISAAPEKLKYRAYWNNAVIRSYNKNCKEAIADLQMAKITIPQKMKKYWQYRTEQWILQKCGETGSVAPTLDLEH